jgi:nucleoside-diphosphate-sugar epimerase
MTNTTDLHVVLGATGGAGNAIARALLEAGLPVRAVNRSGKADLPESIELVAADVTTETGIAQAVEGAAVVYMAAQPPYHRWPEEFPQMLERVIDGVAAAGAKLVMVDNLYGYGPGVGTMTEDTAERATDRKGTVRRAMTEMLLDAHRAGTLRVAIGRASDYFGPRADNSGITALAIEPAAKGSTLRWTASLDAPHSVAYLPDIARAYVTLGTSDKADGEVWLLPHGVPATGRQFLELVNAALPEPLKTGVISRMMLRIASPFHKISKETLGIVYQWSEPFVVDDGKFQRVFGPFEVTPLADAVRTTVAWYREHHG